MKLTLPAFISQIFHRKKVTILIVDDVGKPLVDVQNFFKEGHQRYDVIIASSVEEAKQQIKEQQPDYAVIDLNLDVKGYEGIEIIEFIFYQYPNIQTIILSGFPLQGDVEKRLNKDFSGFPEELNKLKEHYVYKGTQHSGGYLVVLLETLEQLEKERKRKKQ